MRIVDDQAHKEIIGFPKLFWMLGILIILKRLGKVLVKSYKCSYLFNNCQKTGTWCEYVRNF